MFSRLLSKSKYLTILAVISIFILSVGLLVVGCYKTYRTIYLLFINGFPAHGDKEYLLQFIETVDLFLLSTVFYITALGFYELFIDSEIQVPNWLTIKNIDDLKSKLVNVVIVTLAVLFLGKVISWDGEKDLMGYGIAIGAVIFGLSFFLRTKKDKQEINS